MTSLLAQNLGRTETSLRWILGGGLIMAVLSSAYTPAWLALLAAYPVFTAILAWDPLYAMLGLTKSVPAFRTDRLASQVSS